MSWLSRVYNLHFSTDKKYTSSLKELLGFTPDNLNHYRLAFQHKSMSSLISENNERLEFLGDALINSIVAEIIYKKYPTRDEGFMTNLRSKMISRDSLNAVGRELDLDQYIISQHTLRNFNQNSILGNCLEALVGAVYLDRGFKKTYEFVYQQIIKPHLDIDKLESLESNFKSKLLEWSQKRNQPIEFKLISEETLKHNQKHFTIGVYVNGELEGTGAGKNKKIAAQCAAENAYRKLSVSEK